MRTPATSQATSQAASKAALAAARDVADRLLDPLMALAGAVVAAAHRAYDRDGDYTLHGVDPIALFARIADLMATLLCIAERGLRATHKRDRKPVPSPAPTAAQVPAPDPDPPLGYGQNLPRRPGWLLGTMPGQAPAIAAELAAILAEPATLSLLAASPALERALRPLLRSLDLERIALAPPPTPPEPPPEPGPPAPTPPPRAEGHAEPHPVSPVSLLDFVLAQPTRSHVLFVPIS